LTQSPNYNQPFPHQVYFQEREEGRHPRAGTALHPQTALATEGHLRLEVRGVRVGSQGNSCLNSTTYCPYISFCGVVYIENAF
jgi:hypothetical protein